VISLVVFEKGDKVEMWTGSKLGTWELSTVGDIFTWGTCNVGFSAVDRHGTTRIGFLLSNGALPPDPNWQLPTSAAAKEM
jgi:hypothetical protein